MNFWERGRLGSEVVKVENGGRGKLGKFRGREKVIVAVSFFLSGLRVRVNVAVTQ